eukprot:GGOE01061092.1.p1 GENE.GGOE01061092.1~~GGOE01061092.1.p1  ORF type:complete len:244 (+),score=65.07 GGOE01061092.1:37-732(+)
MSRIQHLQQEIASRNEMLSDATLISRLPDNGQKIRNKVELLEGELKELLSAVDPFPRPLPSKLPPATTSSATTSPAQSGTPGEDPYAEAQAYYFDRDKNKTRNLESSVKRMFSLHPPDRQAEQALQRHTHALTIAEAQEIHHRHCERQAEAQSRPRTSAPAAVDRDDGCRLATYRDDGSLLQASTQVPSGPGDGEGLPLHQALQSHTVNTETPFQCPDFAKSQLCNDDGPE